MPVEVFNMEKGYAVFSKDGYETKRHAHYGIEIVVCTEGSVQLTTDCCAFENLKSAIIPSNVPHSFSCLKGTCNLLFVDPLSDAGKYFMQYYHLKADNDIIVDPPLSEFYRNDQFDISRLDSIRADFGSDIDARILKCVQDINSVVADHNVTLAQLARASFLSESRFSHLFKKQTGISVRQWMLWKKMLLAVSKSMEGCSLTECAHYVGFADSSHFIKVFKKMFGINPFSVLKR